MPVSVVRRWRRRRLCSNCSSSGCSGGRRPVVNTATSLQRRRAIAAAESGAPTGKQRTPRPLPAARTVFTTIHAARPPPPRQLMFLPPSYDENSIRGVCELIDCISADMDGILLGRTGSSRRFGSGRGVGSNRDN